MCYLYGLRHSPNEISEFLGLDQLPSIKPYSWYQVDCTVPTLQNNSSSKSILDDCCWGVIVPWKSSYNNKLFHFKNETLQKNRLLPQYLDRQSCVLPCSGFYTWRGQRKKRKIYYICREDRTPFLFAGIICKWMTFRGEETLGCAILTTDADKKLMPDSNRMPFILPREDMETWLAHDLQYRLRYPLPVSSASTDVLCTYRIPNKATLIRESDSFVHPRHIRERKSATIKENTDEPSI